MGLFRSRAMRKVTAVERVDGGSAPGAVYCNVYLYDDESMKTIEFSRGGAHVAEYAGEPRHLLEQAARGETA